MADHSTSVGTYVLEALYRRGVRHIFGIPGDFALNFFHIIEQFRKMFLITLSHEPGLGFAADGSSRITQKLAAVAVTYGAGALNIVNSIACAYAENSPIVVISGAPGMNERGKGLLFHHQVKDLQSQRNVFREITAYQAILEKLETAAEEVEKALTIAEKYARPVYIEIPRDVVTQKCPPPRHGIVFKPEEDAQACQEVTDEVAEKLSRAKRPLIMIDVEVRRFGLTNQVVQLAEKLNVPVVSTFLARATFPVNHPLFAGTYVGPAGEKSVMVLVEKSDCLLLLGVLFTDTNMGVRLSSLNPQNMVHALSRRVTIGHHTYEYVSLERFLEDLIPKVKRRRSMPSILRFPFPKLRPKTFFDNSPITVETIIQAINTLLYQKGPMPVIADNGDCLFASLDIHSPDLLASGYYATMGFAVPAALEVQISSGLRPLVLVGDGAFQMTGLEISHCPRLKLNPIVIVFNNASWEMLRTIQPEGKYFDLTPWNFAKLAEIWNGKGYRIRTKKEMLDALLDAHRQKSFTILDVILPKGETSKALQNYLKRIRG